jgi:protein TonB
MLLLKALFFAIGTLVLVLFITTFPVWLGNNYINKLPQKDKVMVDSFVDVPPPPPPPISTKKLYMTQEADKSGVLTDDFSSPTLDSRKTNLKMDVFEISDLNQVPKPRRQLPPRYPSIAKANTIEGFVIAEFIIEKNGVVESIVIEDSSHILFEEPTKDAILNWVFTPGLKDGQNVRTRARVKIPFTLN